MNYPPSIADDYDELLNAARSMRSLADTLEGARSRVEDVTADSSRVFEGAVGDAVRTVVARYIPTLGAGAARLDECAAALEWMAAQLSARDGTYRRTLWNYQQESCSVADGARDRERQLAADLNRQLASVRAVRNQVALQVHDCAIAATRAEREHYEQTFWGRIDKFGRDAWEYRGDFVENSVDGLTGFAKGLWESTGGAVVGIVRLGYGMSPVQLVLDPGRWASNNANFFKGLWAMGEGLATDPVDTIKVMVNWDELKEDPGRLSGNIVGFIATIILTEGLATSLRAGRAVDLAADTARLTDDVVLVSGNLSDDVLRISDDISRNGVDLIANEGRLGVGYAEGFESHVISKHVNLSKGEMDAQFLYNRIANGEATTGSSMFDNIDVANASVNKFLQIHSDDIAAFLLQDGTEGPVKFTRVVDLDHPVGLVVTPDVSVVPTSRVQVVVVRGDQGPGDLIVQTAFPRR